MSAALKWENEEPEEKKPRGRPKLPESEKRAKIKLPSKKWVPRTWRPEYEVIVSLSATGMSRESVVQRFFQLTGTLYTTQHISNICNTPEAKLLQKELVQKIRENRTQTVQERLAEIQHKAVDRIESLLNDDARFEASPFAVVDRAFKVLDSGKPVAGSAGTLNVGAAFIMTEEAARIMRDGTDKADEAKRLYGSVTEP